MMSMASGDKVYSGTFTIDADHPDFDIAVNFAKDPKYVCVEPTFTPTYGVNSLISYTVSRLENVTISGAGTTGEENHFLVATVEGRSNYPSY